jgi:plasmid stability protein
MSVLTVRNLDDDLKTRLRVRAAQHGRSMEAEAREILRESLDDPHGGDVGAWIHKRFEGLDLDELEPRPGPARVPDLGLGRSHAAGAAVQRSRFCSYISCRISSIP